MKSLYMEDNYIKRMKTKSMETVLLAERLCYSLAEELQRQEPGVTTKRPVLTAASANAVVDLRDVGCDVLYACVVETVHPQT